MADPTKYVPAYSYSGWQASNPNRPLPADEVDNDFANVSQSVNQTIDALKDVRRSDGKLKNQSVGPDQLSPALTIGFTFTGLWVDGREYSAGDGVVKDDTFYSARVAHTADVSNAPGNTAYWNELYSLNDIVVTGGMSLPRDSFVGDGTTTAFALSFTPLSKFNLFVQVGGVVQSTDTYSSNGNTLTFLTAPPNGYGIEVRGFATTAALVTPEDGSVSTAKLADLAVTEPKLANGAVATAKIADGAVTTAKLAAAAFADQATAEAAVDNTKIMTPLRTKQQIDTRIAANADADAGTDDTKFLTPAKAVRWFDNWVTKLWGSSSLGRTQRARWSDTVNLRDWFDRTGADGTATTNNTALADLITYLNANPSVRTLKGNKGDVYRLTASDQVLPSGLRLMMDGARFRWSGTLGGGSSQFLQFATGSHIQGMGIDVVSGATFRRLVGSDTDCVWFDNEILAEAQINNYGGSLLDWAVRVYRDNNKVRNFRLKNIDKAFFAYGDQGDGDPGLDNHFEDIRVESYVTGICLRNLAGARLLNPYVKTKSANALEDPGHNGILHEGVKDYLLANAQVSDSGEHGIRFGGTRNAEQASIGIIVNGARIYRAGQTGFKMFTGTAGQTFANVQVSNVQVVDCVYNGGAAETPGFNDEGFLLQQIRKGTFNGLSVQRQENATYSCMDGVYVSGADNLQINGLHVQDPYRNAVRIAETDDGGGGASVETLANNEVFIRGLLAENVGEDGVFIDHPTQSIRDINIEGEMIGNGVAGFYAFDGSAAIGRFAQPCLFQAKSRNFAAGLNNLPAGANVKVRDVFGSTY